MTDLKDKRLEDIPLEELGVNNDKSKKLKAHGIRNAKQVLESDHEFLTDIDGIGAKTAESVRSSAKSKLEEIETDDQTREAEVVESEPAEEPETPDTQEMSSEIASPDYDPDSVQSLIKRAIDSGAGIETMERLFDLHEKVHDKVANSALKKAKAEFQRNVPSIERTKVVKNKDGSVRYKYAPLDEIISTIKKPLAEAGLSYSWDIENEEVGDKILMEVTCTITHESGAEDKSTFKVPIEENEYMNSPQRYASTQTYAKRYSLCNALGIATGDEDTDATTGKDRDPKSKKSKIVFLLKKLGKYEPDGDSIKKVVREETDKELKEENFDEIINRLEVKVSEMEEDMSDANS